VTFGPSKLAHDTHMSTWVSCSAQFDSSSFQDTFMTLGHLKATCA